MSAMPTSPRIDIPAGQHDRDALAGDVELAGHQRCNADGARPFDRQPFAC